MRKIYFILDPRSNAIKIGSSGKPEERLEALQTANPNPLFLIGVIEGDIEAEQKLHAKFEGCRIAGEWFQATSELLWFIRRATWGVEEIKMPILRRRVGHAATDWLIDRFAERVEWESDELRRLASLAGITKHALFSPEVSALPILKKRRMRSDGQQYWVWRAKDGWPKPAIPERNGEASN